MARRRHYNPPSPATPPRPSIRTLAIQVFGKESHSYKGMSGILSGYRTEHLVVDVRSRWNAERVAGLIFRTVNAAEKTWPDWLPPQKPIIRTYCF